jgi:hypothetical protein
MTNDPEPTAAAQRTAESARKEAWIALQTALAAVGAATVALGLLERRVTAENERKILEDAKQSLLKAEQRVMDWMLP